MILIIFLPHTPFKKQMSLLFDRHTYLHWKREKANFLTNTEEIKFFLNFTGIFLTIVSILFIAQLFLITVVSILTYEEKQFLSHYVV